MAIKAKRQRTKSKTTGQAQLVRSGKNMLMYNTAYDPTPTSKVEKEEQAKQKKFDDVEAKIKAAFKEL